MIVLIYIISVSCIIGVYLIDKEITNSMYYGLSFLNVILCSFLAISVCYMYYFAYKSFMFKYDPDYFQSLVKKFKKFIDKYMIFLNFEENIKSITYMIKNAKPKNKMYIKPYV